MFRRYNLARKKHGSSTFNHFCNGVYDLCPINNPHTGCMVAHSWPCSRQNPKATVCPKGEYRYWFEKKYKDYKQKMNYKYKPWIFGYRFEEAKPFVLNDDFWLKNDIRNVFNSGINIIKEQEKLVSEWGDTSNIKFIKPRERK